MLQAGEAVEMTSVRLVVENHKHFLSRSPELFDWEKVINPKVAALAQMLACDIRERDAEWVLSGRNGSDPLIPGLREALRLIARTAVWCVQSEQRAHAMEATRLGLKYARPVPDGARSAARTIPLPAVRSL